MVGSSGSSWFPVWQSKPTENDDVASSSSINKNDPLSALDEDELVNELLTQFPAYGSHDVKDDWFLMNFAGASKKVESKTEELLEEDDDEDDNILASNNYLYQGSSMTANQVSNKDKERRFIQGWDVDEQNLWKSRKRRLGEESERERQQRASEEPQQQLARSQASSFAALSPTSVTPYTSRHSMNLSLLKQRADKGGRGVETTTTTSTSTTAAPSSTPSPPSADRQHWMPDQLCKQCYSCDTPFTVFRRRHHCRLCGQVFCNTCSAYFVKQQNSTVVRVCQLCHEQVISQRKKEATETSESTANVSSMDSDPADKRDRRYPVEPERETRTTTALSPRALGRKVPDAAAAVMGATTAAAATTTTTSATTATESSIQQQDPMLLLTEQILRQAMNANTDFSILSSLSQKRILSSSSSSSQQQQQLSELEEREHSLQANEKVASLSSSPAAAPKQGRPTSANPMTASTSASTIALEAGSGMRQRQQQSIGSDLIREGNRHLGLTAANHMEVMVKELLRLHAPLLWDSLEKKDNAEQLKMDWVNKLLSLATRCCATIDPNVKKGDLLDIRPYCKIKVIAGGSYRDCAYMSGVLFRKTVSHKQMAKEIENPRVMLLNGSIEFTRTENRIASLETLFEQEEKYMEILVGKILKLKPDVLLVGRSVSRIAQELLLKADVVLVQHVKSSLLARISRQTGATVISSTDHVMNQFGANALGKCHRFRLVTFRDNEVWEDGNENIEWNYGNSASTRTGQKLIQALLSDPKLSNHERQAALAASKLGEKVLDGSEAVNAGLAKRGVAQTFVMLEGCPKHLGCTVVLRGAPRAALKQVKVVFRFMVNVAYSLRLETSYLRERCVRIGPDFEVGPKYAFSSSLCVDYSQPPAGKKTRPWNAGNKNSDSLPRLESGEITAFDHQSILITSVWMTDKTQCCPAEIKGICYYSLQDVALGQFLRDSCFNLSLKCQNPNCKKSVLDHSLSFVHNDGLINITIEELDEQLPSPNEQPKDEDKDPASDQEDDEDGEVDKPIATWTYCKNCRKVVTPLVYISENTWKFSFGKFLEMFFYNRHAIMNTPEHKCSCQAQSAARLYFGCGKLAAAFNYERIRPFGVFVRRNLPINKSFHREEALQRLELISGASSELFVKFDKHIEKISREARSLLNSPVNKPENLQTVLSELNKIGSEVDHAAKVLQEKIASVSNNYRQRVDEEEVDGALLRFPWLARRYLFMLTSVWNEKLRTIGEAISTMNKISGSSSSRDGVTIGGSDALNEELMESLKRLSKLDEHYSKYNVADITQVLPSLPGTNDGPQDGEYEDDFDDPAETSMDFSDGVDADVLASRRRLQAKMMGAQSERGDGSRSRPTKTLGTRRSDSSVSGQESVSAPPVKSTPGGAVKSAITRFFNRGGRDDAKYTVDLGIFAEGRPRLAPGVNGIVLPVFDEQLSTIIAYSLSSTEYAKQFKHYSKNETSMSDTEALDKGREGALKQTGSENAPDTTAKDSTNSKKQGPPSPPTSAGSGRAEAGDNKSIERRMLVRSKTHIKHTFRYYEKGQAKCKFVCTTYWATQFQAVRQVFLSSFTSGTLDAVNNDLQTADEIEQSYVESLSTAFNWNASGGKSGASFARSSDDRFVIKCISRTELQMFLDCAPAYFEYLSKAFFHGLPTVLCKIVGVYEIDVHNKETGKRSMEQVAVMQNIFYNRKITRIFDLKGSLRGRLTSQVQNAKDDQLQPDTSFVSDMSSSHVDKEKQKKDAGLPSDDAAAQGGDDSAEDSMNISVLVENNGKTEDDETGPATLLDGDFLEFTLGRPMPITDRAKAVFQMSILNDTLFLSIINVLDYSILVGIDEENMELVVGVIDFMRQYDILKQMERVGKSLPMVVGSEAPTIIQPPLYKARFMNAMERYFMMVPSKWTTI